MNPEEQNQPAEPEQEKSDRGSVFEDAVDPRDLVLKGRTVSNPDELGSNPAVVPQTQTLNDPADIRDGFDFQRDSSENRE